MHFGYIALVLIFSLVMSSCTTNKEIATGNDSPLKQYDTSKLAPGHLVYQAPETWEKISPTNEMRLDEYVIDAPTNTVASVYFFDGMRGALEANLQRWKSQFKDDDTRVLLQKKQYNRKDLALTIYHLTGTYLEKLDPMDPQSTIKEIKDYALLAAVVEMKKGTWFFKILGPESTVAESRNDFDELVDSFDHIKKVKV